MPVPLPPKLLRFLQEHEFMRLGGKETLRSDARIIAATNRDLEKMVEDGLFREDLLSRLEVITIKVPPLRERHEDIVRLAWHFIRKNHDLRDLPVTQIDPEVERLFLESSWPGNVRRLENTVIHALANGDAKSGVIMVGDLPEWIRGGDAGAAVEEEITPERLLSALERAGQNRTKAAGILRISRAHLYRLMKQLEET